MENVDVAIIGAGIIGASCAFYLSKQGVKVAVLEAQTAPAMGSTARSLAGVRGQFTEEVNIRLSWESIQEYQHFAEMHGEDAEYHPIGYLLLVPAERWEAHLNSVTLQQQIGIPVSILTPAEAQTIIHFETAAIAGTTYGSADGTVDPHRVTMIYLKRAKEQGASLYTKTPLRGVQRVGDTWHIETPQGFFAASYLVNAAGSWAGQVARRAGLEVPIWPSKRMIYATSATSWQHHYPLTIDLASGFYLRSEGQRILFGRSNPNEPPGFTEGVDWDWFEQTLSAGLQRFPWLAEAGLDRQACWWGYYEITPDHNPILGRMPGVENWINAAGFSGHGVQQAPAVGRVIAEEVLQGSAQAINIDTLRIERFADGQHKQERNII